MSTLPTSKPDGLPFDVDLDGDLDALIGNLNGLSRLHINDGSGVFTDDPSSLPAVVSATYVAAFDGDGDLDIPLRGRIFQGWRRQVTAVGAAVRGNKLLLDLRGAAGAPWVLAYANGSARIDVGAFGTLLIDPLGLVEFDSGLLDLSGSGEQEVEIPADPLLSGTTIFLQGAIGSPYRLTNLEITTLQ